MSKQKNNLQKHFIVFVATVVAIVILIGTFTKDVANNVALGLDLQGGFEIVYEVSALKESETLADMSIVAQSVSKRINVLGVSEPQIMIEGENRIRVQLAGIKDIEQARRVISSTANLTFRDAYDNELSDASIIKEGGASLAFENGVPVVSLKIADPEKFGDMTEKVSHNANNIMVIWLDYEEGDSYAEEALNARNGLETKYISAASVGGRIDGDCVIKGSFTESEARELADLINSGSLPVKMTEIYSNVVSADYGEGAFELTARAGAIGVALVAAFMISMYRLPGVISTIMLALYIFAVFAIYGAMGGVFTLPGIAALVLGVGMTVDANVITYERIKEELYQGHPVQKAVLEGQSDSFWTIFDAQFTTLLAALIMFFFGTGTVKGFATMLMVTVVCTLVFNVYVSRFLINQLVKSGKLDNHKTWFGVKEKYIPDFNKNQEPFYEGPFKRFDFIKVSRYAMAASLGVFVLSIGLMVFNGFAGNGALNLGIDFSSGTKITVSSESAITVSEVEAEFDKLGYDVSRTQQSGESVVYVTINAALSQDELSEIKDVFIAKYGIEPNDNVVTPVVGRELVKSAFMLSVLAWAAMLAYVTVRFKWDYAVSCIIALVHDVLIVIAVFAIFRMEVNIELVSVILAIIGYSINNSIVVFDRIRQSVKEVKGDLNGDVYYSIVNDSLYKTFTRSMYSTITTLIPVICLLVLGSRAIITFNFAMLVGLIAGTISSMFIAPIVWYYLRTKYKPKAKKVKKVYKEELDEIDIEGINY
ncbi:MAG: protein translocase subunit SecD [Erysipelotrichaceae bacterium]|nr:protein translocase subunit SecD [Erysipelotrichaceae bacterium]